MNKLKKRSFPILIVVTAFVIILLTLLTEPGMAFLQELQDRFPFKKEITQSIEGTEEKTDVHVKEGTHADYVIYLDETRYQLTQGADSDIISPIDPLPEKYPEVSMEIKHLANDNPEQLVEQYQIDLEKDFPDISPIPIQTVIVPVQGYWLHGAEGNEWDSKIIDIYVVPDGKEGSFRITATYFLEAAEGHGTRFYHMLESFEVIP
ncbi:hypothetical protein AB1K83_14880 [Sporosarcina sp. 179-K 3D1 HS]|uniref:hypothetical protein n=1 Tax=Sporosarcina sp. 179-K 3D1 HS TaxID=3232169 RepID=UPI0039A3A710